MNAAQRKTLQALFATSTPVAMAWRRIESLLVALDARAIEGNGSRVRFELDGVGASFHRPHPHKEAKPYQIRDAQHFPIQAAIDAP